MIFAYLSPRESGRSRKHGFTIIELLVSFAVLAILMVVLVIMVNATSLIWTRTQGRIEQFQQAREAFDVVTRRLSEATLNTYYDYLDASGNPRTQANSSTFAPARYVRQSELRFLSGPSLTGTTGNPTHSVFFHAPQGRSEIGGGMGNLLNTCGFLVELRDDARFLPSVLRAFSSSFVKERFRLLQVIEPSENLSIYGYGVIASGSTYTGREWFQETLTREKGVSILSENIIALVLLPMISKQDQATGNYTDSSLAPAYLYDSTVSQANADLNTKNQLPPIVQVTMVAIDDISANRMSNSARADLKTFLDGLFLLAGSASDATLPGYAQDLKTLEDYLVVHKINYRIFSSNVSLKAAKWSREQRN